MSDPNKPPAGGWFGGGPGGSAGDVDDEVDLLADSFAEFDAALEAPAQPSWVELPANANPPNPYDDPSWLRGPTSPAAPIAARPVAEFGESAFTIEADGPRPDDSFAADLVVPGWLDGPDDALPAVAEPASASLPAAEPIVDVAPAAFVAPEPVESVAPPSVPDPVVEPVAFVEPERPAPPAPVVEPAADVEAATFEMPTAPEAPDPIAVPLGFPTSAEVDQQVLGFDDAESVEEPTGVQAVTTVPLLDDPAVGDGDVAPQATEALLLEDATLPREGKRLPPAAPIRSVPMEEDDQAPTELPTTPVAGIPVVIPRAAEPVAPVTAVPVGPPPSPSDLPASAPSNPPPLLPSDPPVAASPILDRPRSATGTPPASPRMIDAFDRPLARSGPSPRVTRPSTQRPSQPILPFDSTAATKAQDAPTLPIIPDLAADRTAATTATTSLPPLVPTAAGFVPKPTAMHEQSDVVAALQNVPPARFSRLLTWTIPFLLVALAASSYVLARQGAAEFLDSTGGRLQASVTDSAAPGYVALVDPTPSMLMLWVDGLGNLSGVSILSAASDDVGGSVLVMPPFTRFRPGDDTLYMAYENGGVDGVEGAISRQLRIAFGETEVIDGDRWEQLLAPVEPLPIVVTDPLITRNSTGQVGVRFPAGTAAIDASDIVDFLGWRNPDEVQLNQQFRHGQFWDSWIGAVFDGGADMVPGESESGVGRFVRALANGQANIELLPFTEERADSVSPTTEQSDAAVPAEAITVVPDVDALQETIVAMIPFPVAPVGSPRPRVRLLDGIDNPQAVRQAAERLVAAGAQIAILGNADSFDIDQSRIVYHVGEAEADAQSYADALGARGVEGDGEEGLPETEAPDGSEGRTEQRTIDVTVVVGADIVSGLNE